MYKDFVEFNVGMRRPLGLWVIGSMIESAQVRTHLYGYAAYDPAYNSP